MVADLLAGRLGSKFKAHKRSGAEVATGRLGGRSVVLAKPRCYMNESGRQVAPLAKFYSVPPADIVVIHDELNIEFGRIRLKVGGGVAGHNGLRSVASSLGTNDFQRGRIGIGRPPGRMEGAAFVLANFTNTEWRDVPTICEQAADATELLVAPGLEPAQNPVHAWHGPYPQDLVSTAMFCGRTGLKGPSPGYNGRYDESSSRGAADVEAEWFVAPEYWLAREILQRGGGGVLPVAV